MSEVTASELRDKLFAMDLESQRKFLLDFIKENIDPEILDAINTANDSLKIAHSSMKFYDIKITIKSEVRK